MTSPEVAIIVRLVSATYPFRCPQVAAAQRLSFAESFKTVGSHPKTASLMLQADESRQVLASTLVACSSENNGAGLNVVEAAENYLPHFQGILLTCLSQPEMCRLDAKLIFEWASGVEVDSKKGKIFRSFHRSEAMMYELVMTIASNAMGRAIAGCQERNIGDYAAASRQFKAAAGVMQYLAEDQIPKWTSRSGDSHSIELPSEAKLESCGAFKALFLAVGQQMAVATALSKPGSPNWSLLAKLCLGISEQMTLFVSTMSSTASLGMAKIDPFLFALARFQIKFQSALSLYFLARSVWESKVSPGLAIAMLTEAIALMKGQDYYNKEGLPKMDQKNLTEDATQLRKHMKDLVKSWERDNSSIFFESVPSAVPENAKLRQGLFMMKPEPYSLTDDVEPVLLMLPARKSALSPLSSFLWGKKK